MQSFAMESRLLTHLSLVPGSPRLCTPVDKRVEDWGRKLLEEVSVQISLSSNHMGPGEGAQVVSLGGKQPYLLRPLTCLS